MRSNLDRIVKGVSYTTGEYPDSIDDDELSIRTYMRGWCVWHDLSLRIILKDRVKKCLN